jgi:hypothetical protein
MSAAGQLTVEDLWNLPLQSKIGRPSLDTLAIGLHQALKASEPISFVNESFQTNKVHQNVQLSFDIVRHIIEVKKAENAMALKASENAEKRQKIMELIANREQADMQGKSMEELRAMLDEIK